MRTDLTEIRRRHMRHLRRSARITTEQWRRKLACWAAAVVVGWWPWALPWRPMPRPPCAAISLP
ncbi:hypothetical protein RAA17_06490 [Komagataeibacter rhaeticus]|nr:hypothetical protein [Komagataeibacter rhaeticus]